MSKLVKGYLITATFFMETNPADFNTTIRVADAINTVKSCLSEFDPDATVVHKYVQRRAIPDEPKAAEAVTLDATITLSGRAPVLPIPKDLMPDPVMPPIPAYLDASKRGKP